MGGQGAFARLPGGAPGFGLAYHQLRRGACHGPRHRPGVAGSRYSPGRSGGRAVGQQREPGAAVAGGHARGTAHRRGVVGLYQDEPRSREAARHPRQPASRPGLRGGRCRVRGGDSGRGAFVSRGLYAGRRRRRVAVLRAVRGQRRAGRGRGVPRYHGCHHRAHPADFWLHGSAQAGAEHAPDAVRQPADDRAVLAIRR